MHTEILMYLSVPRVLITRDSKVAQTFLTLMDSQCIACYSRTIASVLGLIHERKIVVRAIWVSLLADRQYACVLHYIHLRPLYIMKTMDSRCECICWWGPDLYPILALMARIVRHYAYTFLLSRLDVDLCWRCPSPHPNIPRTVQIHWNAWQSASIGHTIWPLYAICAIPESNWSVFSFLMIQFFSFHSVMLSSVHLCISSAGI